MEFTRKVTTETTVVVTLNDDEQVEVVKGFTSKRVRIEQIRVVVTRSTDGWHDERVYGLGHRVLLSGDLGATETLGEFGIKPKDLHPALRPAYEAARARIDES